MWQKWKNSLSPVRRAVLCLALLVGGDFVRAHINRDGPYTELMYGTRYDGIRSVELWPNGFAWLLKDE